jgi:DNA polymerase-1
MSADAAPLLLLVDGHSLAFRAYYAFANSREGGLRNSAGTPTSICFGFLHSLLQVIEAQQPQLVAVAFDLAMPTFRHEADEAYKADREEPPDDFAPDLENLKALLAALNLQVVTAAGYEADDLLATLAHRGSDAGYRVRILTGDRDLFQLVDAERQIAVLYSDRSALRGNSEATISEVGPEAVREQLQIAPEQVVDYKALCGDKSDNVPGVEGIGPKNAGPAPSSRPRNRPHSTRATWSNSRPMPPASYRWRRFACRALRRASCARCWPSSSSIRSCGASTGSSSS